MKIILDQLRTQVSEAMLKTVEHIVAALGEGRQPENVPEPLLRLFRASVQPHTPRQHGCTGINHVLKQVPLDRRKQLASYGDPDLPVAPKLVEEIGRFILP